METKDLALPKKVQKSVEKTLYPSRVPYIKAFVTAMKLSIEEITAAADTFATPNYFSLERFSPFRCEVAEKVNSFFSSYIGLEEPDSLFFNAGVKEIWYQRSEEITILEYLCVGPKDDTRLILFIENMKASAIRSPSFLWPKSRYNGLIDALEESLVSHDSQKLEACFELDMNASLVTEKKCSKNKIKPSERKMSN